MELVAGVGANSVTGIGKYSVKSITRHVGYAFHFKKNIEDLRIAKEELKVKYETVKAEVERAALNTEVVNKNVEAWLKNVEEVVEALETLENEIQANKGCCNGWCPDWIWRYKQSKEAIEKAINVKELKDTGNFTQVAHRAPTPGLEIFPSSDFEAFESRKWGFDQIMEALHDDNCSRIGVWGMGGVGKTTLVKEMSKKAKELKLFSDIVMAVVSRPPDVIQIQNEIADCLNLKLTEDSASGRARRICMRIKNVEKILIILDDIWEEINFEDIGIPSRHDHKGCKILITTRREHVCNVMSCEKKVQLKTMTEEESLALFKKSACVEDDFLAINDDVVRQVVKECQGLPIAIVVVGKALIQKSLNDWNTALQQLRNSKLVDIEGVDVDKNAYVCLKWSYDHLKKNTKLCFLLCSLFPEDHRIPIEELIRYAIGLEVYDDVKSIEEGRRLVCSSINNLKESSLLLDASLSEYQECVKMHDMVRDVALWIASKGENEFSLRTCTRLENIKNIENITAISLWANNANQLPDNLVCPKLNILLLGEIPTYNEVKNDEFSKISDTLFEGMKGLTVLSLRNKFLSSHSLQILTNLRCLYLVNCNFDDLSSLGKLKSLEILSFRSCRMVALPNEFRELSNLKVLDLLGCGQLERIPPNLMQALSQLEELYLKSMKRINFSLLELMSLSNLAVLSLMCCVNYLPYVFVFPKLKRYQISVNDLGILYALKEYPESRVLSFMNVDASSLNAFKVLFCSVEKLTLDACAMECIIDATGGNMTTAFSNLVMLKLDSMHSLTNLFSPSLVQNLEKLETLTLTNCPELKQIISEEEMLFKCHHIQPSCFPKLKILEVNNCGKLEYLFSISVARGFLLQLEKMIIKDLPELKQVFGDEREGKVGSNGDKFELSELRELSLQNLSKLSSFCQSNISLTWPSLERLLAWSCPKLKSSLVADLLPNVGAVEKLQMYAISIGSCFPKDYSKPRVLRFVDANASSLKVFKAFFCTIEELELEKCEVECFNDTIGGNNTIKFSNLVKLILDDLPSLRTLWEGPIQQITFRNLTILEARSCSKLTNLFSPSLVQNLEKLETLILERCSELKQIISEEEMLFKNHHIQPSCFPKLRILKVIDCGKLEYLFSISVARGFLLQLEKMIIEDLPELKQVFGDEREGQVGSNGEILELSKLKELSLQNLPKLSNFCQSNISSTWPSLERLLVMSCPKMTSSIVANMVANGQAVGKKLQVLNVSNCSPLCNIFLDLITQGLLDLEELIIESCGGLEDLFQHERLLPSSLKILSLKDLLVQRCVWKGPTQLVNLNNLKKFEVFRCNKLRHLFSTATLARSLQQLESLTIEECDELEHLIANDEGDTISLEGYPELVYLNNLKSFRVFKCKKLRHLFTPTLARSLQQLDSLTIEECDELEHLIAEDEDDQILLESHPELLYLNNLKSFRVFKCKRLRHLFTPTLARSLQQLKSLKIEECDELEHLISKDEEVQILSLYFPKLSDVSVKECNKMTSLLPITIAPSLQRLGNLEVEGASQLVEIFAHEDKGDVGVRKDIGLNIRRLTLKHLPSLVSFCPRNYHFILPSLCYLKVLSCPNMSTRFARTLDFETTVHVNGEVLLLDEKDESGVLSTTHQVVVVSPTNKDIDWDSWSNFDALPLFKEEPQK